MILPKNYVWWIQATLGKYIPAKILDIFCKKKTVMNVLGGFPENMLHLILSCLLAFKLETSFQLLITLGIICKRKSKRVSWWIRR